VSEWDRCRHWIEAALPHGGGFYEIGDIEADVLKGDALFWPGEKSAVVTQFWDFPRAKAINFWLVGGDLDELKVMHRNISAWAKTQGCTHSIIAGRAGWARSLGYTPAWTAMSKELP
jgi:hypothetical protein